MLNDNININGSTVLITGAAGFIGSNLAKRLLAENPDCRIVGIDSITDYYDTSLKYERLADLESGRSTLFHRESRRLYRQ